MCILKFKCHHEEVELKENEEMKERERGREVPKTHLLMVTAAMTGLFTSGGLVYTCQSTLGEMQLPLNCRSFKLNCHKNTQQSAVNVNN